MNDSPEAALLKATATKGSKSPSELAETVGNTRTYELMSYALAVGATRRFPDSDPAKVREFVGELQERFPDAEILKPTVAEAVLLAALGDQDRLNGVDPNDAGALLFFLTHVIMTDFDMDDAEVDQFVDSVVRLAE